MANTLYEYYGGKMPSLTERAKIYESQGLGAAGSYKGTAQQNTQLLSKLKTGGAPTSSAPSPVAITPQPSVNAGQVLTETMTGILDTLSPINTRQSIGDVVKQLSPDVPKPAPINRVEMRRAELSKLGVTDLEGQLNQLQAEEEELIATRRTRTHDEEGKAVAVGVISGRVSEVERQENERLDMVGRAKARVVDQLQTAYRIVDTLVQDAGLDYQDAVQNYDREYKRVLDAVNYVREVRKDALTEFHRQQDSARANLQIYYNAVTEQGLDYNAMSPDQKSMINRLEVQSGLPVGFLQGVNTAASVAKVKEMVPRVDAKGNKYLDIVYVERGGAVRVDSKYLGKERVPSSGSSPKPKTIGKEDITAAIKIFEEEENVIEGKTADKMLSKDEAQKALRRIVGLVGDQSLGVQLFERAFVSGGFRKYGDY